MRNRIRSLFAHSNLLQIASYFLIFAILSNLIYLPCYFYVKNLNRTNVIDHQQYQLESGISVLNTSMSAFFNLPNTLSTVTDYNITYYSRSDFNNKNLNNIRRTVNACMLPFDCINECGLIMDNALLFTSGRMYYEKEQLSYDHYFSCDRPDYLSEFSGAYCSLPVAGFNISDKEEYDAVTIGYRWRKNSNMYFFVHYSLESLIGLFANEDVLDSCSLAIYAGDTLLAQDGSLSTEDYEELTVRGNNQLNIRVVLKLSEKYIAQNLAGMTRLVSLFISIVIFAMVLWVFIFSLALSKPYRNISEALYNTGHLQAHAANKGFTDTLVTGITRLGNQLSDYKQILEVQKERSRIHTFEKALYRGLYGEDARNTFYNTFPDFPEKWRLMQIQYTSDHTSMPHDVMQSLLIQYLESHFSGIFVQHNQDTFLVLLPFMQDSEEREQLHHLTNLVEQQYQFSVSFTFSGVYDDPVFLADALQELEYEELSALPQSKTGSISIPQLQTIYSALLCGDSKTAAYVLKSCTTRILSKDDRFIAKYSYQMLGYVLVRLKLENNCIKNIPIPAFRHNNIQKLFEQDLPHCFHLIAGQLAQQQNEYNEQLNQNILDFIKDNLTDQQLSVALVAEHFHISAPTLQKRMNACTGKTFSAYVETVRMEKARQMLKETRATVQEIAESVGYINANSFYKAYKRCFGETPCFYRKRTLDS